MGLGNPGPQYKSTRHNAGFWFIEALAERCGVKLKPETKFHGLIGKCKDRWLLLPTTYMNLSGQAVQAVSKFYKIKSEEILIVHDELDFPPGIIKLKQGGGHAGHNGLRDIIKALGSREFYRLRIGIGHPRDHSPVTDYVLHKPAADEKCEIIRAIDQGLELVDHGI